MKPLPRPPKNPSALSEECHRRLNSYALAAAAAGVGALALVPPAEAKIVYTPAHLAISTSNPQHWWSLDLNHDGVKDFSFSAYYEVGMSSQFAFMRCWPQAGNSVWGQAYEAALRPGVRIGPGGRFKLRHLSMARVSTVQGHSSFDAPWANGGRGVTDRYLGLKFQINGETHYGWARLSVQVSQLHITGTLTGYAYETIPGKGIVAGRTTGKTNAAAVISSSPDLETFDSSASIAGPSNTLQPRSLGSLALGAQSVPGGGRP